ncbi:Hydrolase-4 domain-containing protein [Mycena chlorophos]|uniref:Hydrolase-4 domain-containing protein n=1 Tax=Mycena chlorophos TaxID=658473 RepID=A0A8H6SBN7_MYCCL|nr:Hydrolase-4 domain-containing protein [Mycena chlorophos]
MPWDPTQLLWKLLLAYAAFRAFRPLPPHSNLLPAERDAGLAALPPDSPARILYPETWLSGGAYATLPLGKVKYWIVGPESGKKLKNFQVVLIHGLTSPSIAFTHIVPILTSANFRVLVYDLYGRGYSDAPRKVTYDSNLYVTQLALLLQHVRWKRARIVGYSMGGPIAAAFVAAFPSLVDRDVVMIASAGAAEVRIRFFAGLMSKR